MIIFTFLFEYNQGSIYNFFFKKNKNLVSSNDNSEGFIDYVPRDNKIVSNFGVVLRDIIRGKTNADIDYSPFNSFNTESPIDFIHSIFESNNFL